MTTYRDIQVQTLEYKEPRNNPQTGGKMVNVSTVPGSNDYNHRLRFQMSPDCHTDLQTALYGVSTPMPGQLEDRRRTLELSVDNPELLTFLTELDNKNIDVATSNSESWFKKSMDRHTVENMYHSVLRMPSSADYKPTVRTKVKIAERTNTNVWVVMSGEDKEELQYARGTSADITKGCRCMVIVETSGLWFASKQFGMSLVVTDIMVWPTPRPQFFYLGHGVKSREVSSESTFQQDAMDMMM